MRKQRIVELMSVNFITFWFLADRARAFNLHNMRYRAGRILLVFQDALYTIEENDIKEIRHKNPGTLVYPESGPIQALLDNQNVTYLYRSSEFSGGPGAVLDLFHQKISMVGSLSCLCTEPNVYEFTYRYKDRCPIYATLNYGILSTQAPCLYPLISEPRPFKRGRTVMI